MKTPSIMVSSTFYDLKQLRDDLRRFIGDELGYVPLLSEFPSFPVDPDATTIENCTRRVEQDADVLVLVIGGRYGSIDARTNKSVTNLEYLEARKKGIPIYAYVDSAILALMPVWAKNPNADFSSVVDSPRLLEFVKRVRDEDSVWAVPFSSATDIISSLRIQLAHLFYDAIHIRHRVRGGGIAPFFVSMSPQAIKLALEKPIAWEYKLFLQGWADEMDARRRLLRLYEAGLRIGISDIVTVADASNWIAARTQELQNLIRSIDHLVNVSAAEAIGPPGVPASLELIVWVYQELGEVFERLIEWVLRIRRAYVSEPFGELLIEISRLAEGPIGDIRAFPVDSLSAIDSALIHGEKVVTLSLKLRLPDLGPLTDALDRAQRKVGLSPGPERPTEGA